MSWYKVGRNFKAKQMNARERKTIKIRKPTPKCSSVSTIRPSSDWILLEKKYLRCNQIRPIVLFYRWTNCRIKCDEICRYFFDWASCTEIFRCKSDPTIQWWSFALNCFLNFFCSILHSIYHLRNNWILFQVLFSRSKSSMFLKRSNCVDKSESM